MPFRTAIAAIVVFAVAPAYAAGICDRHLPCQDTAVTTTDMVECGSQSADAADAKLNALWPKVMALYDGFSNAEEAKKTLRQSQREWIKFRDNTCQAEYDLADGGTIGAIYSVTCNCAVTQSRIADFERMITLGAE